MNIRLHHFGIVVADIETYLSHSLWELRGAIVTDSIEQARLCLAGLPDDPIPMIELIEPLGETSPAWGALQRGTGFYHLCIGVPKMSDGDALIREKRLLPVTPWQPAALFEGRAVRFIYTRNRELLELLADETTS